MFKSICKIGVLVLIIFLIIKFEVFSYDKILVLETNDNLQKTEIQYLVNNYTDVETQHVLTIKETKKQLERSDIDLIYITMHGKSNRLILNNGKSIYNFKTIKTNIKTDVIFSACNVLNNNYNFKLKPGQIFFGYKSKCFDQYSKDVLQKFFYNSKKYNYKKAWCMSNIKYYQNMIPVVLRGL